MKYIVFLLLNLTKTHGCKINFRLVLGVQSWGLQEKNFKIIKQPKVLQTFWSNLVGKICTKSCGK